MGRKWLVVLSVMLVFTLSLGGSAFAFSDIKGIAEEADIMELKAAGVVDGISADLFAPRAHVTYAQGVHMIVKGMKLNIDNVKFVKEPKASDYFTNVPDDAWYARSFIIAHLNGLPIPKDVNPNKTMTREEFAHLLFGAIGAKGDYAFIEIWTTFEDEKDVNPEMMESVQRLLATKIASLKDGHFYPKRDITRSEAAQWLNKAIKFVKNTKPIEPEPPVDKDVTMTVEKVNDEVNKVIVSWGTKPNLGYSIGIRSITFESDGQAVIEYELHYPKPGEMYGQMIHEPKAETYVSSKYKPVLKPATGGVSDADESVMHVLPKAQ